MQKLKIELEPVSDLNPEYSLPDFGDKLTRKAEYKPCLTCKKHPSFANIPPVTLFMDGRCVICEGTRMKQTLPNE